MQSARAPASNISELRRALGITATFAEMLVARGLDAPDAARSFLDMRLADLTDPSAMADRDAASDRLAHAIRTGEHVVVFGDYDVDGITSAAIVTQFIRTLGGRATPILASRFDGGYGFSVRALERVRACSPGLVVTCDCGSSDHPRLADLRKEGVDVIVIDHHLVPDEPLPVTAFLNPHRPECGFPFKHLASCGLALSIAAAVRTRLGVPFDVRPLLDLVALGTIADVAPLVGDNRALVKAGLARLSVSPRPGLDALCRQAGLTAGMPIAATEISFRLAPRINAPGRLGAPDRALDLLLCTDPVEARAIAASLDVLCDERREIERRVHVDALAQIEATGQHDAPAIVVAGQGWHIGVVGIVAARLVDRFAVPTLVIALEGDDGRGSARGPEGCRLHDALTASVDALVSFGGHQAAAGVHVRTRDVERLRARFAEACAAKQPAPGDDAATIGSKRHDVALQHADALADLARDLDRFEPCGEGNRSPRLHLPDVVVEQVRVLKTEHLRLTVRYGARRIDAFGFGLAAQAPAVGARVDLFGQLRRDTFRGRETIEIRLLSIEAPRSAAPSGERTL